MKKGLKHHYKNFKIINLTDSEVKIEDLISYIGPTQYVKKENSHFHIYCYENISNKDIYIFNYLHTREKNSFFYIPSYYEHVLIYSKNSIRILAKFAV